MTVSSRNKTKDNQQQRASLSNQARIWKTRLLSQSQIRAYCSSSAGCEFLTLLLLWVQPATSPLTWSLPCDLHHPALLHQPEAPCRNRQLHPKTEVAIVNRSGSRDRHSPSDRLCLCHCPVCVSLSTWLLVAPACQTTYLPINLRVCPPACGDKEPWVSVVLTPADLCRPLCLQGSDLWENPPANHAGFVCTSAFLFVRLLTRRCVCVRADDEELLRFYCHISPPPPHNLQTFF